MGESLVLMHDFFVTYNQVISKSIIINLNETETWGKLELLDYIILLLPVEATDISSSSLDLWDELLSSSVS